MSLNTNTHAQPPSKSNIADTQKSLGPANSPYLCDSAGAQSYKEDHEEQRLVPRQAKLSSTQGAKSSFYIQTANIGPHDTIFPFAANLDEPSPCSSHAITSPNQMGQAHQLSANCLEDVDLTSSFSAFPFVDPSQSYCIVNKFEDNYQSPYPHLAIPSYQVQTQRLQTLQSKLPEVMNGTPFSASMSSWGATSKALCNSLVEIGVQTLTTTARASIRTAMAGLSYFMGDL